MGRSASQTRKPPSPALGSEPRRLLYRDPLWHIRAGPGPPGPPPAPLSQASWLHLLPRLSKASPGGLPGALSGGPAGAGEGWIKAFRGRPRTDQLVPAQPRRPGWSANNALMSTSPCVGARGPGVWWSASAFSSRQDDASRPQGGRPKENDHPLLVGPSFLSPEPGLSPESSAACP